jgi:hypothetical protein
MNDILIASLALLVVVTLFVWSRLARQRRLALAEREAHAMLDACNRLLDLLEHLQQHRGMSSAWLAGDKSFEARMRGKRDAIEAIFPRLQAVIVLEGGKARPCLTANEVNLFRFKWRALVDDLAKLSVEESIAMHSQLINSLLIWLSDLGEARIELPASGRVPHSLVRNYAYRLPTLAECLGQARAIGSSVAARHSCSPVARVRLLFLLNRAESLLAQAYDGGGNEGSGLFASNAVASLAGTIRTEMLAADRIDIAADAYFRTATQAIDAVYQWIKSCGQALERDLGPDGARLPASKLTYGA